MQDSLAQAAGATEAATLVMTLTGNGDLPVSAAATALDDTLTATLDAATSLATLDVANLREADLREAALGAVQATTSAIVASASALAEVRPEPSATALTRLSEASDLLASVTREASR